MEQKEFNRLKRRLTARKNALAKEVAALRIDPYSATKQILLVHEARRLIKEVDYAMGIFQDQGYPDAWATWERAREDAQMQIRYNDRSV